MALTNAFHEAVQSGNVQNVRIMMKNSLLFDPTFVEFHAMEQASSSMSDLYDAHDQKAFRTDPSSWDDDYLSEVTVDLIFNFSHKRLNHLKEVIRHLRPVAQKASQKSYVTKPTRPSPRPSSYEEEKRRNQERGDFIRSEVGIGAVAGAVVGAGIAVIAGATAVGIAGSAAAGAVVGGVATTLIVNKE